MITTTQVAEAPPTEILRDPLGIITIREAPAPHPKIEQTIMVHLEAEVDSMEPLPLLHRQ